MGFCTSAAGERDIYVAIIGGASTIGSTVAYTLAATAPTIDVSLVDPAEGSAWAHATDLTHAGYHFANTLGALADTSGVPPTPPPEEGGEVRSMLPEDLPGLDPDLVLFMLQPPRPRTRAIAVLGGPNSNGTSRSPRRSPTTWATSTRSRCSS